ncbi:hypothetical protein D3C71_1385050 [compost metagenome]
MQAGLDLGLRQEVEEGGDTLVFRIAFSAEDPQACSTRNGVLGPSFALIIGQLADTVFHAGLDDVAKTAGGFGQNAAFAGGEQLLGFRGAAAITEGAVLGEIGDRLEMLDEGFGVEGELDVGATETVLVTRIGEIVPCGKVLGLDPGQPC